MNLVQRIISSNVSFLPGKMLKGQCSLRWTLKEMKPSMVLLSTQWWAGARQLLRIIRFSGKNETARDETERNYFVV